MYFLPPSFSGVVHVNSVSSTKGCNAMLFEKNIAKEVCDTCAHGAPGTSNSTR